MNGLFFKEKERIKMTQRPQMEQLKKRAEAFHQKPSPDYGKVIRRYKNNAREPRGLAPWMNGAK